MMPFRSIVLRVSLVAMGTAALIAAPGCSERPVAGGPQELALAQAAAAHDVAAVQRLLDAGADPNRVVQIDGGSRAPWAIALREVRPHQPDRVAIVKAMLK